MYKNTAEPSMETDIISYVNGNDSRAMTTLNEYINKQGIIIIIIILTILSSSVTGESKAGYCWKRTKGRNPDNFVEGRAPGIVW